MQRFTLHPVTPQRRLLAQAASQLRGGALVALPTDACYVLACQIGDKAALERMRRLRGIDDKQLLSLLCRDLSELSQHAQVDNRQYRLLKLATPGAYTFILPATKEVPRRLSHPSRRTIGLRVPEHRVTQDLLALFGEPLLSTTLIPPGDREALNDAGEVSERLDRQLQFILDAGACPAQPTTVLDLSQGDDPILVRQGRGELAPLGLQLD